MKWKLFTLSVLMISLIGMCYAEDVSVELIPDNINTHVGDTFNLNLTVKNVPKNATCSGFETCINYNPSILNLTNIKLSDISNNTTLKATNVSSGKISLAWFSNPPYGNFTVATLSFKALNEGSGNISLRKTVIS
ncbi:cohesin domain-containing protein, partial [Methanothermococcus sp.]|uniref:cohesin domain-containing protein n=1 Tax=Methanothermococcus sp. TaxID=2614238 RepID=UPI0025CF1A0E